MKQLCIVGLDFLGLSPEEAEVDWKGGANNKVEQDCFYFKQVEDDPEHPFKRAKVCGNCIHYIVMDITKESIDKRFGKVKKVCC